MVEVRERAGEITINGIDVFRCNTPFTNGYQSPHIFRNQAESIIVRITYDNGMSAYGESTPRPYVTGENPESVAAVIRDHFSPLLLGREIISINTIRSILSELEEECRVNNISSYLSALGAIDVALMNSLSKNLKIPLSGLLGPVVRENITYTLPIPLLPVDAIRRMHEYLTGAEFGSVKVLMEESVARNVERLEAMRSLFGSTMEISIEANGKWTYRQAIDNLNHLKVFNIAAVEQPVHSTDVKGLQKIREIMGIPIIVDESMCTVHDAELLISSGACDILNIKISKCGGLLRSKQIADFALSKGVHFQVGTHVGETDILNRAGQALAFVSPNVLNFEGFSSLLFKNPQNNANLMQKDTSRDSSDVAQSDIGVDNHCLRMIYSLHL